jgi:uncharacterized membrane protein YgaE (UPF0421/DUF939 family)
MADNDKRGRQALETTMGAAIAIGVGVGTALFAAADNPVWIGVGAGIGAAVGAALHRRRAEDDDS